MISDDEMTMINRMDAGETVVLNMNRHRHAMKHAIEKGIYQPVDRRTKWGNPFTMPADGDRDTVCDRYASYMAQNAPLLSKIHELKGMVLGCHCHPLRCHGDHLKRLADSIK